MNFPFDAIYDAAMSLLPASMNTLEAKAEVLAIGLQEGDGMRARRQYQDGPARGFWQFEQGGGVRGVMTHSATKPFALAVLARLQYEPYIPAVWVALEHNDVLACVFARLNLYWLPSKLPGSNQEAEGWRQYIDAWRPGKPHPAKWPANFAQAWQHVSSQ